MLTKYMTIWFGNLLKFHQIRTKFAVATLTRVMLIVVPLKAHVQSKQKACKKSRSLKRANLFCKNCFQLGIYFIFVKMSSTSTIGRLPFTCLACNVCFSTADHQRDHYKSEWHRYNLKRKVAMLPPVTATLSPELKPSSNRMPETERKGWWRWVLLWRLSQEFHQCKAFEQLIKVTTPRRITASAGENWNSQKEGGISPEESSGNKKQTSKK